MTLIPPLRQTGGKKLRLVTRAALLRLAVLFVVLCGLGVWVWTAMIRMPGESFAGPLPSLTQKEVALRETLKRDVQVLAGDIGERSLFVQGSLMKAASFIEASLAEAGYQVRRHGYEVSGTMCHNLEAKIPGGARRDEIVVIGAHYDSVSGSAGANDNASGVAALLALARSFSTAQPGRTVRFVAFVNEEPPFFWTAQMGSRVYAKECRSRGENIVAMVSLETIGYFSDEKGSQKYPFPVGLFYPSRGDFIAFVGNTASRELVRQCVATFRRQARFPSEGAALPGLMPGVGWSDHSSFWREGYPALMVTDTAPFRYPHYHTAGDTPDKIDYGRLVRVVSGLENVIRDLVNPTP